MGPTLRGMTRLQVSVGLALGPIFLTGLVVAGCSAEEKGSSGTDSDITSTPPATDTSGSPTTDAGAGPGERSAGSTKRGEVFIIDPDDRSPSVGAFFSEQPLGAFFETVGSTERSNCTQTVEGSCFVRECDHPSPGVADAGAAPARRTSAGDITMSGGNGVFVLTAGADGIYEPKRDTNSNAPKADMLTVKATGAEVPAFVQTVTPPPDITTAVPDTVSRSVDVKVDWMGGGAGQVEVDVETHEVGAIGNRVRRLVIVHCTAPAPSGTVTVPKALLAKLLTTSPNTFGTISVTPKTTTTFLAGDYTVTWTAAAMGAFGIIKTAP